MFQVLSPRGAQWGRKVFFWLLRRAGFWLALITLLAGCATDLQVDPDETCSAEQRTALEDARATWASAGAHGSGTWRVTIAPLPDGHLGETDRAAQTITIAPELSTEEFRRVALHELGHAYGMEHVFVRAVMFWNGGDHEMSAVELQPADLDACRSAEAC